MVRVADIEWIVERHALAFAHHENLAIAAADWCRAAVPLFNQVKWSYEESVACLSVLQTTRRAHDGVGYLCEQGLGTEAIPLVRKLFEAYVHAKYIRLNPAKYATLFVYHPIITEFARKERLWRLKGKPLEIEHYEGAKDSQYVNQVNELMDTLRKLLGDDQLGFADLERLGRMWSGTGLLEMCKAIDREPDNAGVGGPMFEKLYEGEFRDLCEYTHGTGSNIAQGITLAESTIEADFRRTDTYVPHALIQASKLYIWLLHDIAQVVSGGEGLRLYAHVVEPLLKANRKLAHDYNMTTEIT